MVDELNALLARSPRFDRVRITVAFVKRSGVSRLKDALEALVQSGGIVEVVAGFDHRGTSKQGLEELLKITSNVFVFRDNRQNCTFHTKSYLFERTGAEAIAYVGSSNLTAGGIYSNYETNVRYDLDLSNSADITQYQLLLQVYENARQRALLLDSALLADIERRNWLGDENQKFVVIPNTGVDTSTGLTTSVQPSPFPPVDIPVAPRPSRSRPPALPRPRRTVTTPTVLPPASLQPPASTLIINYTNRDVSDAGGKSGDFQITKEVRNANPAFWQWEEGFTNRSRRTNVVINGAGPFDIRVYDNSGLTANGKKQSGEFRINSVLIRKDSAIGDLLRIDRMASESSYEYELTRIPQRVDGAENPIHTQLLNLCQPVAKANSPKVYAYI